MHKRRFMALFGSSAVAFAGGAPAEENSLLLASRAEAEATRVPPGVLLLQVLRDGVLYRYVRDPEGTALTSGDGSRWSPAETPSLLHWGVTADGETDDAGPITRFVTYLDRVGREGYVPMGTYAVSHVVCRELRRSLVLRCHADAHFLGLQTYEVLPELSGRSHDITAFPVSQRGVQVAVWNGERMVSLQSGRDYDLAGNRITWRPCSDTLAAVQGPVRIVSGTPMISLGSQQLFSGRCIWQGGVVDNSRRGFAPDRASGSGLALYFFESYHVSGVRFRGGEGYEAAQREGVTDTALTIERCSGGAISGNLFSGQADAGIYITGGKDLSLEDNSVHHLVQGNRFSGCHVGVTSKRDARGTKVAGNTFEGCYVGAAFYNNQHLNRSGRGIVSGNEFLASVRRGIDIRATRAVLVSGNVIRDIGRDSAGMVRSGGAGIEARGVRDALIADNLIVMELSESADATGIRLAPDVLAERVESDRVTVQGNTISGFATGIRERGEGRDNLYRENVILGATRPMDVPAGRSWQYRDAERAYEGPG